VLLGTFRGSMDAKLKELRALRAQVSVLESEIDATVQQAPAADHLVFFYGESCPFTKRALPAVTCLERALRRPVVRRETWSNAKNHDLWKEAGGEKHCGGVPYFFNATTGESVCGAADCETLKKWATVSQ
jgi:hypothetical protein